MIALETYLNQILSSIFGSVPAIIYALILLLLAWLAAFLVKTIVVKLCLRLRLDQRLSKAGAGPQDGKGANDLVQTFGKIAFVIIFLLFLPGVLDTLQLQSMSQPIVLMMNSIVGFLPNIVGAAAIFFIGLYLAKIIKQIVISVLKGVRLDKLQEKMGIKSDDTTMRFSTLIGSVVYALILIPVAISALYVLNIDSITTPAINMLDSILGMVPNVGVAIVLVIVGIFVGRLVGSLLSAVLSGLGIDNLLQNYVKDEEKSKKFVLSKIIGSLVKYIIILLLVVQSFNVLQLEVLNNLGAMVVMYLPDFIGALIIFAAGFFLASVVDKVMKKTKRVVPAGLVKTAILVVTVFMTLNQLKVASTIVNTTFVVILCAIAVAFAISFGIGGKDTAARVLKGIQDALSKKDESEEK